MDVLEPSGEPTGQVNTRERHQGYPIAVHARVLPYGVHLRGLCLTDVIGHQQIFDGQATAKNIASDEEVDPRPVTRDVGSRVDPDNLNLPEDLVDDGQQLRERWHFRRRPLEFRECSRENSFGSLWLVAKLMAELGDMPLYVV